jgi:hypothetical protein
MDIATARVEPHEIAKSEDFEFGFQGIIRNSAILDRMLISADVDYVAGGFVRAIHGTMTVSVDAIWANGRSIPLPAFRDTVSDPVSLEIPAAYPRIDIIQVRGCFEDYDVQRRAFYEPELQVAQYHNISTKRRLIVDTVVKQGVEGVNYAPEADSGYIKIAEIRLEPETYEVLQENIQNVAAVYQGEENTEWTTEKSRTFLIGSVPAVWKAFDREHYTDGRHREAVIKARNILLGVTDDSLKSSVIPVGENIDSGDLSVPAVKTISEALAAIGKILHGDVSNTSLKKLTMMLAWKSTETYQPFMPTIFYGRIYYANPENLPASGESPGNSPAKWLNAAGDVVYMPQEDGRLYGMKNRMWTELDSSDDAILALKFYSKKSIMFTNARIVDRRLRGWDLGIPYLSENHEVYHFDTDNNNQHQQSNIAINYNDDAPVRKGLEDSTGTVSFEPAVFDTVPYEMMGKSLYGAFSVAGQLAAENSTLELWMRIFIAQNSVLLRLGTQAQDLVLLNIGGTDPEYDSHADSDIPYSSPDIVDDLPYSTAMTSGNALFHDWGGGSESIDLDAAGVVLSKLVWLHIALELTSDTIEVFIGDRQLSFIRRNPVVDPMPFKINEDMVEFNLDELSIIEGIADFNSFSENNIKRIPYAALDYRQKYAVIMIDDPEKLRTNLFESSQFREAVQAIIDGGVDISIP